MGRPKDKSPGGGEGITPHSFKETGFLLGRGGCLLVTLGSCMRYVLRHARNLSVGQRARAPPKAHVARMGATKRALSKISSNVMSLLLTFLLTLLLTLPPRERSSSHQSRSLKVPYYHVTVEFNSGGEFSHSGVPPSGNPGFGKRKV